jgi:hypothetical protein
VRGLYPDELDEDGADAIGRAYVEQFEPRGSRSAANMRLSSPAMQEAPDARRCRCRGRKSSNSGS